MLIRMKTFLILTILTLVLQCINGDIGGNINQPLPLNSLTRIPSPTKSLQPPIFENPIKDYTVGLVPPPIDGQSSRDDTRPRVQQHQVQPRIHVHSNSNTPSGIINSVQQRSGYSTVRQKTHHSSNQLQPQVYQPKTAIYQPFQHQFTAHHQHHYPIQTTYSAGLVRQPVAAGAQHNHHHKHFVSTPQYYEPVTQRRVHQHSTHTHFVSTPVQRAPAALQYAYPSVQQSAFVPRPVSSYGGSIIQTYPSAAYTAIPQYGSMLNFGNAQLDPELVQIISEVYGQNH